MTFLLSEDDALRKKLQGMVVDDQKANAEGTPRQVGVWFGQPDQEIRSQNYPYVTIDMISISRDPAREHRGIVSPEYLTPDTLTADTWQINYPIPVSIDYQITTYSRHPRHDRQLNAQLLFEKFPIRFGYLELDDNTVRRLDVMDVSKRDVTEQAKRLFVNVITVRVSSEVPLGVIDNIYKVHAVKLHNPVSLTVNGRTSAPDYFGVGEVTISE